MLSESAKRVQTVLDEMVVKVEPWVVEPVKMADATFVRSETGFAIGGVPPIGHIHQLLKLIDEDLLQYDTLWAAAGTPKAVFQLSVADLFRITKAIAIRVL